jgi:alpha-L-rhamnosidase
MIPYMKHGALVCALLIATAPAHPGTTGEAPSPLRITDMYCDHAIDPPALDSPRPTLGWTLVAKERGSRQTACRILVSRDVSTLKGGIGDLWDSGRIPTDNSINVVYGGTPLASGGQCFWQVRVWDEVGRPSAWSPPARIQVGLLDPSDWHGEWLSAAPAETSAAPLFRSTFSLPTKVRRATAYIYGLGWYELYLNGTRVGDQVLAPANSHYDRVNLYDTYDVTSLLREQGNAAGVILGGGYDTSYSRWGWKWDRAKRFILQIAIELEDGSRREIVSDGQWRCHESPITACGIYGGETYDARKELDGWSTIGFDDRNWSPVTITDPPGGRLVANTMPPLRVVKSLSPVAITQPRPGVYVVDMGQNFAGWSRIQLSGQRGDTVRMHYSELIDPTGMIDPWTSRRARATDIYVLKGAGTELYEPRFTYHGFRYIEITGLRQPPAAGSVEGRVVHAAFGAMGSFATSDEMLGRVASNFRWGMTSNFMSIPTDCAMRDERTPCSMDSRVYEEGAMYFFPMYRYYRKWVRDTRGGRGNPDWDGDQVVLPWRLYMVYGDASILRENYVWMKAYVDTVRNRTSDLIYRDGYGDWCAPNQGTWPTFFRSVAAVNTATFFECARTVANTADVLSDGPAATRYRLLADSIRTAYNAAFFHPKENSYADGSQTEDIMPLALGIVPAGRKDKVAAHLAHTIVKEKDGHLDTGINGTRHIGDVLCDNGYADLALQVFTRRTYPGFGHQVLLGATTTWEQWNAKGEMHSHNHAMFSGAAATLFSRFGGVQQLEPGFRRFVVRPAAFDSLKSASVRVQTERGQVVSSWQRKGSVFTLTVEVPVGTQAEVHVPASRAAAVFENGKRAQNAPGVKYIGRRDQREVFSVGSGAYSFTVK